MGCSPSKDMIKHIVPSEPLNTNLLKSSPDAFVTFNSKAFSEVYKVGKLLGKGTYGDVREATHKLTGQERAVKIFRKDLETQESYLKVKNEISILRKINHPIIIKIFEYFEDDKKVYIVLEKCEGGELFEEIFKNKYLRSNTAAIICKQLFSAIAYMHENMIIHRDLKPENILLDEKEDFLNLKLIDFGSATHFTPNKKLTDLVGSAFYIAPEVLKFNYNEKCDLWSSGVILYILLCGIPPFSGNTNEEIVNKIKKGVYAFDGPI